MVRVARIIESPQEDRPLAGKSQAGPHRSPIGETQPLEPVWDATGFGNNSVQTVAVTVGES